MAEIRIGGIGISQAVIATIVTRAAEGVEGVASVGVRDLATNLVTMLTAKADDQLPAVSASVEDGKLVLEVRLSVFFGYHFRELAAQVRSAVAAAIDAQVGVEVARIDVCIDNLVFPKE